MECVCLVADGVMVGFFMVGVTRGNCAVPDGPMSHGPPAHAWVRTAAMKRNPNSVLEAALAPAGHDAPPGSHRDC